MATALRHSELLEARLRSREAQVAVLGLGYAGLPMAVACAEAGYPVLGLDVDQARAAAVQAGVSPVTDVEDAVLGPLVARGRLRASTDMARLDDADVALICVPTPLTAERAPELRYVRQAAASLAAHAHPGQLLLLQSTCGPGTTRRELGEPLKARGLRPGTDVHVAHAPERIDPGNTRFTVRNTPKLVGGLTARCTELASLFYQPLVDQVVPVANPEIAELSKLVENTFRFVNISLMNEMAQLCDQLGVNVWEVLQAAGTKPFAYLPHWPSAGVGGHCIPIVPFYLVEAAREAGVSAEMVSAAGRVNDGQPAWVVEKLTRLLADRGQSLDGARVLLLGMAYKPDVADLRESAALAVLENLVARGASVAYHDQWVPTLRAAGTQWSSTDLADLNKYTAAVLLTAHSGVDYARIAAAVPVVLDTSNKLAILNSPSVVPL
jgi:UDP-N-acetyl-D-glucosamine dehydrogenase